LSLYYSLSLPKSLSWTPTSQTLSVLKYRLWGIDAPDALYKGGEEAAKYLCEMIAHLGTNL